MSEIIDNGGPAFPHPELVQDIIGENGNVRAHRVYHAMPGMELRDWLAGQALAPLIAAAIKNGGPDKTKIASDAYDIADAMITARKGLT